MKKNHRQPLLPGFEEPELATNAGQSEKRAKKPSEKGAVTDPNVAPAAIPGPGDTVYVIDAHSLIYQVFHAMPEMTGPSGQPVGAIHGFFRDVLHIIQDKKPTFLFCAFDPPGGTFRDNLFEAYKADREAMPDDLQLQMPNIRRMLHALCVSIVEIPGYEADDVLATIARRSEALGADCFLVTADKDCRQLLSERVKIYNIRKGELFDVEALRTDWGIRPDQVVDFQSLVGDSVDSIPGVPLIGPKNARELLQKYETLDAVLDHANEVSGNKRRENLIQYRDQALLSRQLARLEDDVPFEVDWTTGRVGGVYRDELQDFCREFGFRAMLERLQRLTPIDAPQDWNATYRAITTSDELSWIVGELQKQKRIVVDTETTSASPRSAELVGLSFAWQEGEGFYLPVRAPEGEPRLEFHSTLEALRPILENEQIQKVGQNIKYDTIVLRNAGVTLRGAWFDTMVADYLLSPGERVHNLDDLSRRFLNHRMISIESLIGSGKNQKRMDEVPVAQVAEYAAEDADVPLRLVKILEPRLEADELMPLFAKLEMPLVQVLVELEYNGIKIDVPLLNRLSEKYGTRMNTLRREIHEAAGEEFNVDSPSQLSKILFGKLKLPAGRRTQTGHSTDIDVLSELVDEHPIVGKVIEYRQLAKLKSGYLDALPELVNPVTGRVHTSFKQDVAATGRLSSTDPNLQNIPVRNESGREIRSAFLPGEDGWKLLAADYSQIELRVLAHFSNDQALLAAFEADDDIHTRVAAEVYGVPSEGVTKEMRRSAKAINFGVIYGQSPFGLAKSLGISKEEAAQFIQAYFARFSGVIKFINEVLAESRRNGYVTTVLGRRRAVQGVRDPSRRGDSLLRNLPERIAINTVIQGSAADLIKQAMINVHSRIGQEKLRSRMLLQIHDELVFETPPQEIDLLAQLVRREMASAFTLRVPLKVDVKVGDNWADCEKWD